VLQQDRVQGFDRAGGLDSSAFLKDGEITWAPLMQDGCLELVGRVVGRPADTRRNGKYLVEVVVGVTPA
jgi:hypothetical protein